MPRFYFDVRDRKGFHRDDVGDVCDDFEDAIAQAQSLLPTIARDELPGGDHQDLSCDVRDDASRVVYQAVLSYRGKRLPN
ncbi:MAG: DUF6894 family protein [Janthinobacterium lividum]